MYPRNEDDDWYYGEENDGYDPSWDSEMDLGSIDGDFDDADESDDNNEHDNGDDDHDDDD